MEGDFLRQSRQNGARMTRKSGATTADKETTIRSADSFMKFEKWVRQLKRELPLGRVIDIVSVRMRTGDSEDHHDLAWNLECLLSEAGRYREALQVLDEMIERYPDDVRSPISKATLYLYFLDDPEEALKLIDVALQKAHRTRFFRREVLGVKARILLRLGRGEQLSQVLEEIMLLQMVSGVPDIGRERDFVDRAPPGLISEDIVARYNQFCPKRAEDTLANEPPEFEPPDDVA
jgi:tetratricopeptide (TPR) repeat protein